MPRKHADNNVAATQFIKADEHRPSGHGLKSEFQGQRRKAGKRESGNQDQAETRISRINTNAGGFNHRWTQMDTDSETKAESGKAETKTRRRHEFHELARNGAGEF